MEIYVPSGIDGDLALEKTTHLAIAAHHDDIEIMAYDGILKCFAKTDKHFTGVVVTNGAGSPRSGIYESYTDEQMQAVRKVEQKKAAFVGEYSAQVFLDYTSGEVKDPKNTSVIEDIKSIIEKSKPDYIYTHNLADKHDTHIGVVVKVIKAIRELNYTPKAIYGCEVWRGLDWLGDKHKVIFDVSGRDNLGAALLGVFDSQIAGGKRYDLATVGRWLANATYSESHGVDKANGVSYAMDLTPLALDHNLDIRDFILKYVQDFADNISEKVGLIL